MIEIKCATHFNSCIEEMNNDIKKLSLLNGEFSVSDNQYHCDGKIYIGVVTSDTISEDNQKPKTPMSEVIHVAGCKVILAWQE